MKANVLSAMIFFLACFLVGCSSSNDNHGLVFVTNPGLGLDKWASIWLIKRYIDKNAKIHWVENGVDSDTVVGGVLFDMEKALYKRRARQSTFSTLVAGFNIQAPHISKLEQLVHDIEINYWSEPKLKYSNQVEHQFRRLQTDLGFEKTPVQCYLAFFDYIAYRTEWSSATNRWELNQDCAQEVPKQHIARERLIPEWPVATVLKALEQGKRVVFIDVRETEEFLEDHIPGAMNIKIREIADYDINELTEADIVIPYCVKDFRGFEMARLLKQRGLQQVVLMKPYGLKGWLDSGLPLVNARNDEHNGRQALLKCARYPADCLPVKRST